MNKYKFLPSLIDYSVSNDNRKRVVCSIEIGIGLFLIILGIGTATCQIEEKENK